MPKHNDRKLILILIQGHTVTINIKYLGFCCDVTSRGLPEILGRLKLKAIQFSEQVGNISPIYVPSHHIKIQSSVNPL